MSKEKEKKDKLIIVISLITLICVFGIINYVAHKIWFFPKSDVKIISFVDFWPYQEHMEIKSLTVELKETRFGLMSLGQALIRINVTGEIKQSNNSSLAEIEMVHINERLKTVDKEKWVEVEILPIVNFKETNHKILGSNKFDVNLEYIVHSYQWGSNNYIFNCGNFNQKISCQNVK